MDKEIAELKQKRENVPKPTPEGIKKANLERRKKIYAEIQSIRHELYEQAVAREEVEKINEIREKGLETKEQAKKYAEEKRKTQMEEELKKIRTVLAQKKIQQEQEIGEPETRPLTTKQRGQIEEAKKEMEIISSEMRGAIQREFEEEEAQPHPIDEGILEREFELGEPLEFENLLPEEIQPPEEFKDFDLYQQDYQRRYYRDVLDQLAPGAAEPLAVQAFRDYRDQEAPMVELKYNLDTMAEVFQAADPEARNRIQEDFEDGDGRKGYEILAALRFYLFYVRKMQRARMHSMEIWLNLDLPYFGNTHAVTMGDQLMSMRRRWMVLHQFWVSQKQQLKLPENGGVAPHHVAYDRHLDRILALELGTFAFILRFLLDINLITLNQVNELQHIMLHEQPNNNQNYLEMMGHVGKYAEMIYMMKRSFINDSRIFFIFSANNWMAKLPVDRDKWYKMKITNAMPHVWCDLNFEGTKGEEETFQLYNLEDNKPLVIYRILEQWVQDLRNVIKFNDEGDEVELHRSTRFEIRFNFIFAKLGGFHESYEVIPPDVGENMQNRYVTIPVDIVLKKDDFDHAPRTAEKIVLEMIQKFGRMLAENIQNYQDELIPEELREEDLRSFWRMKWLDIYITLDHKAHAQQGSMNWLQVLNKLNRSRPTTFCRRTLGSWRDYVAFSQSTDRLCLFETWHQIKYAEEWQNKIKRFKAECKRNYILAEFEKAPIKVQLMSVEGDVVALTNYMRDVDKLNFNLFFWELGAFDQSKWRREYEYTIVVKDAHALVVKTSIVEDKLCRRIDACIFNDSTTGQYTLKPKKEYEESPKAIVFDWAWDIETCPDENGEMHPYMVVISEITHPESTFVFEGLDCISVQLINFFKTLVDTDSKNSKGGKKKQVKHRIWGFNSNRFDGIILLPDLITSFNDVQLRGSMTKIRKLSLGANVEFLDLWAICPCGSLDSMVEAWLPGTQYKKGELDHKSINLSNFRKYLDECREYCINDVVITGKLVEKWIKYCGELKINPAQTSCSSFAMSVFRTHYLKDEYLGLKWKDYQRIKQSYCGGINWVLQKKMEPGAIGYEYDFNSCYPKAMTEELPIEHLGYLNMENAPLKINSTNYEKLVNKNYLYHVTEFKWKDDWDFPFFMRKHPETGEADFPHTYKNMEYMSIWGESLRLALQEDLIDGDILIVACDQFRSEAIFKEFIEDQYEKRKAATTTFENQLCKLVINNSYGKMGQKMYRETEFCAMEVAQYKLKMHARDMKVHNVSKPVKGVYVIEWDNWNFESNIGGMVHVASKITDTARCRLMAVNIFIRKYMGKKTFYFDTDSCFTDCELPVCSQHYEKLGLPNPLVDPKKLGCLKVEFKFVDALFVAKKVYCVKDDLGWLHPKMKGVPKRLIEGPNIIGPKEYRFRDEAIWNIYENLHKEKSMEITMPDVFFRKTGSILIKDLHKALTVKDKRNFISEFESKPYN